MEERPDERRRGRVVAADDERAKLVDELPSVSRLAALVARVHEEAEDVLAALGPGPPARDDLVGEERADLVARLDEPVPGPERPERPPERGDDEERRRVRVEHRADRRAEVLAPRLPLDTQHRAEDDVERDPRMAACKTTLSPVFHDAASARVRSRMIAPYARIRSPWNGGVISLRSRWWRSPARRISECRPSSGSTGFVFSGSNVSGGAEKTSRAPSGCPVTRTSPIDGMRTTNGSPRRAWHRSKYPSGSIANAIALAIAGRRGAGRPHADVAALTRPRRRTARRASC